MVWAVLLPGPPPFGPSHVWHALPPVSARLLVRCRRRHRAKHAIPWRGAAASRRGRPRARDYSFTPRASAKTCTRAAAAVRGPSNGDSLDSLVGGVKGRALRQERLQPGRMIARQRKLEFHL
ncbi:hypothetical protein PVAP13_7NG435275 [Panicum virgatum]|uniref:Uncharacterized protein n=1 Tax=Panicum virgatum TaxID=38727 RepID=A0A8T0Q8F9_PANVG|nr:hypothetical protein PVAP13_7NG435275 [Panicum virgatum]